MNTSLISLFWLAGVVAAFAGARGENSAVAVSISDHAAIQRPIEANSDVNMLLPDKSTVLHRAVDRQDRESVALLLAAGARPNTADIDGITPLMLACELGDPVIVTSLLNAGADARAVRPDGVTALSLCAGRSTSAALEVLVEKGAEVNHSDANGQTPLMWAAARGDIDNIKFLVSKGANVNAMERKGFTPLFFALRSKVTGAAQALVEVGADTHAVLPDGGTSVMAAALVEDNVPFAVSLVVRGMDVNERDGQGRQLIHLAAASGKVELVKLALAKGADPNAMSQPPSPAAQEQKPILGPAASKLARADGTNAPPPPPTPAKPPLIFAAEVGSLDTLKMLVASGAKPTINASDGTTLVLASAGGGNLDALKYAIGLDPDINAIGSQGKSIMHYAVSNTDPDVAIPIIQFLVEKGAKLDVKDAHGDTPGDVINRGGQPDIRLFYVQLLKRHGLVDTPH
jgi:ankyrin repeat protein